MSLFRDKKIKIFVHILIIFLIFFIQTSIFPLLPHFNSSPNLLLIITFSYSLFYGEYVGMATGFFCGLLCDMYFNGVFGLYILIYTVIGYVNGTLKSYFFENTITFPMILAISNGLAYNFYIYITHFLIRKRFDIGYYFIYVILPNVVFTLLVTVIVYKILYRLNIVKK